MVSTNQTSEDGEGGAKSWLVATVAVTLISCVGLIAVVIVPALQRINYKYVLHFFIALAIGALSGDSMLHLLPHALYEGEVEGLREKVLEHLKSKSVDFNEQIFDEENWESLVATSNPLTKGVVALCGLLLFFLSQRAMVVYGDLTKERKHKFQMVEVEVDEAESEHPNANSHTKVDLGDSELKGERGSANADTTLEPNQSKQYEKLGGSADAAQKRSSTLTASASCNDRLSTSNLDTSDCATSNKRFSLREPVCIAERYGASDARRASANVLLDADGDPDEIETNDVALLTLHQLGTLPPRRSMQLEERLDISTPLSRDNLASAFGVNDRDVEALSDRRASHPRSPTETRNAPRRQPLPSVSEKHEDERGHGHKHDHDDDHDHDYDHDHDHEGGDDGHGHGHSHKVPHDVRSLITMVILGDGLHNFTDGLAVGVAFAGSIAGGLSTAVAVFCHELPHELGDFAVLLKSGLSLKMALLFNMMSSVLSFIGMILGLLIGSSKDSTQWVYCIVAGIFLYIALVNMLPELNPGPGQRGLLKLSLVQLLGLLLGISVMFLIAFYEHDIKEADLFGINGPKEEKNKDSNEQTLL